MTTQKDFKRLVRGRMRKTGESYTAARARLMSAARGAPRAAATPSTIEPNPSANGEATAPTAAAANFEKLAATGAVFRQFYVGGNESQTSHATVWTGTYPAVHNVRLAGDGVGKRNRVGRVLRHELAQAVDRQVRQGEDLVARTLEVDVDVSVSPSKIQAASGIESDADHVGIRVGATVSVH